jgi:hypothetical protein
MIVLRREAGFFLAADFRGFAFFVLFFITALLCSRHMHYYAPAR